MVSSVVFRDLYFNYILCWLAPWQDHLFDAELNLGIKEPIKYVVYQRNDGSYSVQCAPVELGSFTSRKRFPLSVSGLRDEELSKKLNIEDCVFIHSGGFIGANKSYEGAVKMALFALQAEPE